MDLPALAGHPGRRLGVGVILAVVVWVGNAVHVSLFFGVDYLFGSVAALLAAVWLGPLTGAAVAAVGGLYTWELWGHPWALVLFTLEAGAVGVLYRRFRGLILADLAFWLILGAPLALAFYQEALGMQLNQAGLIALKQPVNGLFNALVANAVLLAIARYYQTVPLRELVFNLLFGAVFLVGLALIAVQTFRIEAIQEAAIRANLRDHLNNAVRQADLQSVVSTADPVIPAQVRSALEPKMAFALAGPQGRLLGGQGLPDWAARSQKHPLAPKLTAWLPPQAEQPALMLRWKEGFYASRRTIGGAQEAATAVALIPAQPAVLRLTRALIWSHGLLVGLGLVTALLAWWLSRGLTRPFQILADRTRQLPERIAAGETVSFPDTHLAEPAALGRACHDMATSLQTSFQQSEKDRAEMAALYQERETFLRSLFAAVPDIVYHKGPDGRYRECNPAFERFADHPETTILGRTDAELFEPEVGAFLTGDDTPLPWTGRHRAQWVPYPNGQWAFLDLLETPLSYPDGETGILGIGRDLTDRKRAEEEQARFAALISAAPDLVGFADLSGVSDLTEGPRPTYLNPAGRALLGLSANETLESAFSYHPEWAQERLRSLALPEAYRTGIWRGENAVLATDGTEIPVEQTLIAHPDGEGGSTLIATIMLDLRDQKRAEEALRRTAALEESFANALIDAVPEVFYLLDERGQFHRWNRHLESLTGLTPAEIQNRHPLDFFPEADQSAITAGIARGFREGESTTEALLNTVNGPIPFRFHSERIAFEGHTYLLGFAMDVSQHKALEAEQRLLAKAFHTHEALMITDPDVCIERVNPAFTAITGYASEEVIGANPRIVASGYHDQAFYQRMWQDLAEHDHWEGEVWNRRRNGEIFPVWEAISAVRDEAGRLEHYVALFHDISRRKEAEAERDRFIAILEETPDCIGIADAAGNILYQNRAAWEVLGFPPDTDPAEVTMPAVHPEWAWQRVRDEGLPTAIREGWWSGESALLDAHGREVPVSQILLAHFDEKGQLQRTSTIMHDLSEQKALQDELAHQARHDPLTGLLNRRPLEEYLGQEIELGERYGTSLAVTMFDIDHFKAVNDTYGHEVGDRILLGIASAVSTRLRGSDLLARWGGEEFVVLLPETNQEGAVRLAEELREGVAATDFHQSTKVTISLGVVEWQQGETLADVTRRADEALYAAKEAGRNQVVTK